MWMNDIITKLITHVQEMRIALARPNARPNMLRKENNFLATEVAQRNEDKVSQHKN
jgi:hypothetical protein